jgi:hypothetical protein
MINAAKFATFGLALATACWAQEGLTIDNNHKERMSTPEAEKVYLSACSVVREDSLSSVQYFLGSNLFWAPKRTVCCGLSEGYGLPDGTAIYSLRVLSCWPLPISCPGTARSQ